MTLKLDGGAYRLTMNYYEKELLTQIIRGVAQSYVTFMGLSDSDRLAHLQDQGIDESDMEQIGNNIAKQYRFCNDWLHELISGYTPVDIGVKSEDIEKMDKRQEKFDLEIVNSMKKHSSEFDKLTDEETNAWINKCISVTMEKQFHDAKTEYVVFDTLIVVFKEAKENKIRLYVSKDWQMQEIKYDITRINP